MRSDHLSKHQKTHRSQVSPEVVSEEPNRLVGADAFVVNCPVSTKKDSMKENEGFVVKSSQTKMDALLAKP